MVKSRQFALVNEDLFGLGSRFYVLAFWADGNLHPGGPSVPGWPVEVQGVLGAYGAGQDFITEGGDPASAADIDGDGVDEGLQRLAFAPPAVVDAGTAVDSNTTRRALSDATDALTQRPGGARRGPARVQPHRSRCSRRRHVLWDAGAVGDGLRYASGGTDLEHDLAAVSRQPIRNYQRRALDGFADPEPGAGLSYAADGASFLTAPAIADLGGDGKPDVIIGSDTSDVAAVQHDGARRVFGRQKLTATNASRCFSTSV